MNNDGFVIIGNQRIKLKKEECDLLSKNNYAIETFTNDSFDCNNPYFDISYQEIEALIYRFIFNQKLIKVFGKYVRYENNKIVQSSEHLFDLLKDYDNKTMSVGFENIVRKEDYRYNFFGSAIKYQIQNNKKYSYAVKFLNNWVGRILSFNNTKDAKEYYLKRKKELKNKISFDEFKNKLLKWKSYMFADCLNGWLENYKEKLNRHNEISIEELNCSINDLLMRYSIEGTTLFQKVNLLSDFKKYCGLYVFVSENLRGVYIGQTTASICRRIVEHINHPSSSFDYSILPEDIDVIYVLTTPNDPLLIDRIERDCIATIGPKISLNSSVGGHRIIAFVHDENYDRNKFLMTKRQLNKTASLLQQKKNII